MIRIRAEARLVDVPDSPDNAAFFGRGGNGSDSRNPYPQLRALVLAGLQS